MKPFFSLAACLIAASPACLAAEPSPSTAFVLNRSESFTLKSAINGREYRIFVSAPSGEAPAQGFPVLYSSDGNAMFPQLTATANLLGQGNRAIVVGIGYPGEDRFDVNRRYFDLTPKTSPEVMKASGRGGNGDRETGGNDLFLDFIEKELKPLIEAKYKVDKSQQTLFGHSLGGLFVLHALFSRPGTFQTYLAAAPSIWWNNQSVLEEAKTYITKPAQTATPIKLFIATNTDLSRRGEAQPASTNPAATMESNAVGLVKDLQVVPGLTVQTRNFENETHMSMVPSSISSGLRFALGDAQRGGGNNPRSRQP